MSPARPAAAVARGEVDGQARLELVRMAYRELRSATLASAGAAVVLAVAVHAEFPSTRVWIWLGAMVAVAGYRLWLGLAFHRSPTNAETGAAWATRYLVATTATGLGWGVSCWLFPTLERTSTLGLLHVLMLAGLTAGSVLVLLPLRTGSLVYLLAVTVPLGARFFANGDLPSLLLGGCVGVFIAYMIPATRRNHRTLAEALVMRFERERLASELQEEDARRVARERELRDAHARAESAARAKGEFLATISHEIRTPMNGVLGMLRIVRDTSLTPEQREYLKTAADSAETLLLLLNDVLDFSKIEAGKLELHHAPFPPAATAQTVSELWHARARDKGLHFELRLGDNLPAAIINDAARLRQILVNLIGNAIKFTERGRVELAVTCARRTPTEAEMHFTVTDTGIGIDSAALDRLFKPFAQADASLARRYGGTGLGLAISLRLAQAMGGVLQVQSTVNKGTTFRLILPCKVPELAPLLPPASDAPRNAQGSPLRGRVLVVEDDSINQQVIELFLKKLNVTPRFAENGETAIGLATAETFDLILMDCQLPGIDGIETTRRIRQKLTGGRPVKIIALTANANPKVRENCLAAGMDDFLTKPVRLELLASVLERNLPPA